MKSQLRHLLIWLLGLLDYEQAGETELHVVIGWMVEAKNIHQHYIDIDQESPELVGDDPWHDMWVKRYDHVITLLEGLK